MGGQRGDGRTVEGRCKRKSARGGTATAGHRRCMAVKELQLPDLGVVVGRSQVMDVGLLPIWKGADGDDGVSHGRGTPSDAATVQTEHVEVAHALRREPPILERQLLEGRRCRPEKGGGGGRGGTKEQKPT